jgi:hypothetical protein
MGGRNHTVAGGAVLVGAALIAVGATQAWATGALTLRGWVAGETPHGSLGFDRLLGPGDRYGDVIPLLIGGATVLGVSALLLFVTRIPVVGILWRFLALATVVGLGVISVPAWSAVNDPASMVADPGAAAGRALGLEISVARSSNLLDITPGPGLWLLTIGIGIAGVGALTPAMGGRRPEPEVVAPSGLRRTSTGIPPGWYPDELDDTVVRFFDGVRWTAATRPRG